MSRPRCARSSTGGLRYPVCSTAIFDTFLDAVSSDTLSRVPIFADGFESGDTSGWSATVTKVGASLVPLDDPADQFWTSLRLEPEAMRTVTAGPTTALAGIGTGSTRAFTLELRRGAEGLEIRAGARTDDGRMVKTDWVPIGGGDGWFELDWRRSAEDRSDGRLDVRSDGVPVLELNGLDNSSSALEAIAVAEVHGRPIVELKVGG